MAHEHTDRCTEVRFKVDEHTGALSVRLFCLVTRQQDPDIFHIQDARLSDDVRDMLQHQPDLNDFCLLTRCICYPLSITNVLTTLIKERKIRFQGDYLPFVEYYFDLAINKKDKDMCRLLFIHFFTTEPAFAAQILTYSNRNLVNIAVPYLRSVMREFNLTIVTPGDLNMLLESFETVVTQHFLFKRVRLMEHSIQVLFCATMSDDSIFENVYPPPPFIDAAANAEKMCEEQKLDYCKLAPVVQLRQWPDGVYEHWQMLDDWRQDKIDLQKLNITQFFQLKRKCYELRPHDGESTRKKRTTKTIRIYNEKIHKKLVDNKLINPTASSSNLKSRMSSHLSK